MNTENKALSPIPIIDVESIESPANIQNTPILQEGINLFLDHGFLVIKNAFDPDYLRMLQDKFAHRYKDYFVDIEHDDALNIGDKRTMVTIDLEAPFGSSDYFAPPTIFPLLEFLLTERLIIASMGCVVSLPGSEDQHRHRDSTNIYDPGFYYPAMESFVANAFPYAITLGIPLVPITKQTGSTRFWPGTHLRLVSNNDPDLGPGLDFEADLGSCYLFDYRILHCGVANTSDIPRPLLYNIYTRPWFKDPVNYSKQNPINITEEQLFELPDRYQRMFSWALGERAINPNEQNTTGLCMCGSGLLYKRCHGRPER
ncbi:MAG: phytanoyl-CoA dioxygenase family protein [Alphaproteobacteria bacterium]|nr:phytanoyl-CoA dioxygenase family protein [Alphaproteobacteria bacterium]